MKTIILFFCLFLCVTHYSQNETVFFSAEHYTKEKCLEEIEKLNKDILQEPSSTNYYLRGFLKIRTDDFNGALTDINKAIQLAPNDYTVFMLRGQLYQQLQEYEKAINDFNRCIDLRPKLAAPVYFNRAYSKSFLFLNTEAIEDYTQCIALDPTNHQAYFNRGILYKNINQFEKAIHDYSEAIRLKKDFLEAYQNRAIVKSYMNRKDGMADFTKVIELDPNNGENYFNRAIYAINMRITFDYCSDLKKAIQLHFKEAYDVLNDVCK